MTTVVLIVSLGGFLMGFDASVISGVVGFIELEFSLSKFQLGWAVASLTLTAALAMMVAGPLSDRMGRLPVLKIAAVLFAVSAVASAVAPNFPILVIARMLGGFGVGAALIIAPMYIAEMAPAELRGRLVSFNQLNIVIGISVAFFSNYLILQLGQADADWARALRFGDWGWRWMLAVETLPAMLYFFALLLVPESPRWLAMRGRASEALQVLQKISDPEQARRDLKQVQDSLASEVAQESAPLRQLFHPTMKLVMTIGISVAVLQQITGINSVFFYAPMIFEQSGIGTDASFMQAILVGLINIVFTVAAIALVDKLGRRHLLSFGLAGIAVCMLTLSYGFGTATYTLDQKAIDALHAEIGQQEQKLPLTDTNGSSDSVAPTASEQQPLAPLANTRFTSDIEFRQAVIAATGRELYQKHESALVSAAISMNPMLILFGILGFVASFAISLGPVMWVLFSELFPNRLRGLAISFVGLINSAISFGVQLVFPWELENLGNAATFFIYGLFAVFGLVLVLRLLPETRGRSLEELEHILLKG